MLQLAKHECLAQAIGQRGDRRAHLLLEHAPTGRDVRLLAPVHELALRHVVHRHQLQRLATPAVTLAPHDREQPRARVRVAPQRVEIPDGTQDRLLRGVLRVAGVVHEIARQHVRGIEVRQNHALEARVIGQRSILSWSDEWSRSTNTGLDP